jgi:A/G-specific adenine glycosylase
MNEHGGRFPQRAIDIATLPGIGRSTAAAIAAFCFGERAAILDGNVKRVLCRAFGIEGFPGARAVEERLWRLADTLMPAERGGDYIQAQMDLGATLCTRSRPDCTRCPLASDCVALATGRVAELPQARPKKAVPQRHVRVAVIEQDGLVLMERRPPSGIWGGLLALPEIADGEKPADWLQRRFGAIAAASEPLGTVRHVFSHFRLDIEPVLLQVAGSMTAMTEAGMEWLALDALDEAGLPAPIRRILDTVMQRAQAR